MKKNHLSRGLLAASIFGFFLMSLSILLVPFEKWKVLPGLMFWGGMFLGIFAQVTLELRRRAFFSSYGVRREKMQKKRIGLLTFASNPIASVADNAMVASIVATVTVLVLKKGTGYLCYILLAATLFTFCLHCIFNGRIYFHVQNQNKIRQVLEQKKVNLRNKGEGTI